MTQTRIVLKKIGPNPIFGYSFEQMAEREILKIQMNPDYSCRLEIRLWIVTRADEAV